jgi:hypothetical protein
MVKLQVCKLVTMKDHITHTHTVQSARIYNLPYTNTAPQDVLSSTLECICAGSHHCSNYMDVMLTQKYKHVTYHIQNNKLQMFRNNWPSSMNMYLPHNAVNLTNFFHTLRTLLNRIFITDRSLQIRD